ncbi:MAG: autotransporter domain-containing protein [Alphaproteobacteria bacterium]|nr:autotransporter domain-containing protein [Alphaproteobacteria bacterium]
MSISFKKILLTGTALVAVSFVPMQAEANPRTMAANGTWASSGAPNCTLTTISTACTGDAVAMSGAITLTVTNDSFASDDGVSFNDFELGAVTNTAGNASIAIINDIAGETSDLNVIIDSAVIKGGFSVSHLDPVFTYNETVNVTNDLTTGQTLKVINNENVGAQSTELNVGGNLSVGTTTTLTAGPGGGGAATADINVTGNSTFKGATTINGGGSVGSDATLTLSGTSNAFTGGLTLNDSTGNAILVLNGGGAQTVSGAIDGSSSGEGTINIDNSTGVTFSGVVGTTPLGAINIAGSGDSKATFKNTTSANNINLGDGSGSEINTLIFDATTTSFTVTGDVDGLSTSETNNIEIKGTSGKTVTANGDWGNSFSLNDVTLTSANLTTGSGSNLTANTITVGAGMTLTAGDDVTAVAANGLLLNGAGSTVTLLSGVNLFGDVDANGTVGTLNLNGGNQTVFGDVGNSFALSTIKAGQTGAQTSAFTGTVNALTINGGAGDISFSKTVNALTINGGTGDISFGGDVTGDTSGATINAGAGTIDFGGNVDGAINFGVNDGTVTIADGFNINGIYGAGTVNATKASKGTLELLGNNTIDGAVGATQALKAVKIDTGGGDSTFNSTVNATTITMNSSANAFFNGAVTATNINFSDIGTMSFADNVTSAINFLVSDGTVTIDDSKNITGAVTTVTNNNGTLTLLGSSTVSGSVGAAGKALSLVEGGAGSGNSSFLSTVNAQTINITGANTVNFAGAVVSDAIDFLDAGTAAFAGSVTGAIDFGGYDGVVTVAAGKNLTGVSTVAAEGGGLTAGTLTLSGGTQTVSGTIGATDWLEALNAGALLGTTTFNDTVNSDTINVGTGTANFTDVVNATAINVGTGTVKFNDATGTLDLGGNNGTVTLVTLDFTGDIDNATGLVGGGTLNLSAGTQTVTGFVGATKALTAVNAGATGAISTFSQDVNAGTLKLAGKGTVNLDGDLNGSLDFGSNKGTVVLADGKTITGAIDNLTGAGTGGTLTFSGDAAIGYAVGSLGKLDLIEAGATAKTVTFSSAVAATTLKVNGTGLVNLTGLTGDLDFNGNGGTVTLASNTSVSGVVTNSGAGPLGNLILGGGSQTINGAVALANGLASITAGSAALDVSFFTGGTVNADTITLGAGTTGFANAVQSATINTGAGAVDFAGTVSATTAINLGAGTADFGDVVTATAVNLTTGTADFGDDITGTVNFTDDGFATLAAGSTVTGAINNTTISPTGTLTFAGSGTVTGAIGASKALKVINFDGVGQTIATGNFNAAATTNLNDNTVASTGVVTMTSGQTINAAATGVSGLTITGGNITSATGATISASTKVNVDMSAITGYIANGAVFTLVDSTSGGAVSTLTPGNITDNSFFFGLTQSAGTDLDLVVVRPSLASLATTPNGDAVGNVLDVIDGSATGNLMAVQIALQNASSAAGIDSILDGLVPSVAGEAVVGALNDISAAQSAVNIRMAELRTGDGMTGMTAGDDGSISGENIWLQTYGQTATQDAVGGVKGYSSDTVGFAMGIDSTNVYNNGVFGLSFNLGKTTADADNTTTTSTDVDSYGLNLYTSYDLGEDVFFNGQFGYAYNKINSDRHNVVNPGDAANADYNSHQFSTKLALGSDYSVDYSTLLTPSISADYTHLATGGYAETGIGNAGLEVSSASLNILKLGVGVNTTWNLINRDGSMLKPSLRAGYTFNLINDKVETTSSFIGDPAGATFTTTGPDPDRSAFNLGGGLTYMTNFNWDLSGNYDYTYKTSYTSHAGVLRATARF